MYPEIIGRYKVISELGRGGMASVYKALDPSFNREVAIKLLPETHLHNPQFRARFEREARTIAALEHPAIVPVYDFGETNGQPFIVMRLMPGGSLTDRLANGALPVEEAIRIIARIAPALDSAHKKGIIHRDLKPDNILFDQYDNAYISDFGIARLQEATTTLTGGAAIGTPAYMSPEQVQGDKSIDHRSDIYSMGIILYQMLTGEAPYQASTPAKIMMMHVLEPIPDIHKVKTDLPKSCESVLEKSLAKEPSGRFDTAETMAKALREAIAVVTQQPQPKNEPETYVVATQVADDLDDATRLKRATDMPYAVPQPVPEPVYSPPAAPIPQVTPSPSISARPVKKKASPWPKIIALAGAVIICGTIGMIGLLALGSSANGGNDSPPPINATAVALGVQATQNAKIELTQQAIIEQKQASIERGWQIASAQGCLGCHTVDGIASIGPTWKGFFGSTATLADGKTLSVDIDFIRASILNPNANIISGYSRDTMPSNYVQTISTAEIDDLVHFIVSLGD
jgi:serine/threonine protein kinase